MSEGRFGTAPSKPLAFPLGEGRKKTLLFTPYMIFFSSELMGPPKLHFGVSFLYFALRTSGTAAIYPRLTLTHGAEKCKRGAYSILYTVVKKEGK